jgi:hypothetical protein
VSRRCHSSKLPAVLLGACTLLAAAATAHAGGSVVVTIDGNKAKADITLPVPPPGSGNYTAELELEFEAPHNLTVACLGIAANVLSASDIVSVNSRLPNPGAQAIDPLFPVRVVVEPPAACGLQFYYDVKVTLETDDLVYQPYSVYRLMKAPIGGMFQNITSSVTAGSVRARGSGGSFSEFVMVEDTAQNYDADAMQAYGSLETRLNDPAIGLTAQLTLQTDLALSKAAYVAGNIAQAIAYVDQLDYHCAVLGGPALPNTWRSLRDLVNAEGEVVSYTGNLRFALQRLNGSP